MPDVTDQTFATAVMERSAQVPVIVDLWADWCQPCKQLTPILEKVIAETNGAVELAKVNVEENQQVAQMFQVTGIPAVFALKDGKVVDAFQGAKGEGEVREFVSRLLPSAQEEQLDALVAAGDLESLHAALEIQADYVPAVLALAELLIEHEEAEAALGLLNRIPESPETRRIAALARMGDQDVDEIEAKLDQLLTEVKTRDEARQEFVDLLEVMGPEDPRVADYRRRLSSALF